jgi:hypothetical protein
VLPRAHRGRIVAAHARDAALQRLFGNIDQAHRDTRVCKAHGNTAAHRARTDHRDLLERHRLGVAETRHFGGLAFGMELVNQRGTLRACHALLECLRLKGKASSKLAEQAFSTQRMFISGASWPRIFLPSFFENQRKAADRRR